jgi:hypothetical protein
MFRDNYLRTSHWKENKKKTPLLNDAIMKEILEEDIIWNAGIDL